MLLPSIFSRRGALSTPATARAQICMPPLPLIAGRSLSIRERAVCCPPRNVRQRRHRDAGLPCGCEHPTRTSRFRIQYRATYSQNLERDCGDFLVRRSDQAFAYQLAVVVDDAAQGVNSVVRGVDLLCSTPQQIYLQNLLSLPHPIYGHIPLLVAKRDRRLSKRDHDASLDALLVRFGSPEAIIGHIAGIVGLAPTTEPATPEQLLSCFSLKNLHGRIQIAWI